MKTQKALRKFTQSLLMLAIIGSFSAEVQAKQSIGVLNGVYDLEQDSGNASNCSKRIVLGRAHQRSYQTLPNSVSINQDNIDEYFPVNKGVFSYVETDPKNEVAVQNYGALSDLTKTVRTSFGVYSGDQTIEETYEVECQEEAIVKSLYGTNLEWNVSCAKVSLLSRFSKDKEIRLSKGKGEAFKKPSIKNRSIEKQADGTYVFQYWWNAPGLSANKSSCRYHKVEACAVSANKSSSIKQQSLASPQVDEGTK